MHNKSTNLDEIVNLAFINKERTEITLPLSVSSGRDYIFYGSFYIETGRSFQVRQIPTSEFQETYNILANSEDFLRVKPKTPLYKRLIEKKLIYPVKNQEKRPLISA